MNTQTRRRFGRTRSFVIPLLASFLAVLQLAAPIPLRTASAGPEDHKFISLRGRVVDEAGAPLPDVRVEATGTREAVALTGLGGHFSLSLDLGTMRDLVSNPVIVHVRARLPGYRVSLAGGEPDLAFEVKVGEVSRTPTMETRSNFGLIADALLDALSPQGERTAVLQVRFVGVKGTPSEALAELPADRRSASINEPWMVAPAATPTRTPARPAPPAAAPSRTEPAPPRPEPARVTAPPKTEAPKAEKPKPEARTTTPRANPASRFAPPGTRAAPLTHADSLRLARDAQQRARVAAAQRERDSLFAVVQAQSRVRKAVTDSLRAVRDAYEDSLRRARFGLPPRPAPVAAKPTPAAKRPAPVAARGASEDSLPQNRFGLPVRQPQGTVLPDTIGLGVARAAEAERKRLARDRKVDQREEKRRAREEKKAAARAQKASRQAPDEPVAERVIEEPAAPARVQPARPQPARSTPASPTRPAPLPTRAAGPLPSSSGLQRVEQRPGTRGNDGSDAETRAQLEADTCACVVRGTVELEFHRLLTSPMRIEVAIQELPAIRDTIELFMGSPRAFEMRRVPCGRWSLSLRPFSERPFGVTTPEEVAPFDCRQRALRQVRVVIAPL